MPFFSAKRVSLFFNNLASEKFYGKPTGNDVLVKWGEYLEKRIETAETQSIDNHNRTKETAGGFAEEIPIEKIRKLTGAVSELRQTVKKCRRRTEAGQI